MKLSEKLQERLKKKYTPSSFVETRFHGKDVSFKTDKEGNPVVLFIGKATAEGRIRGERYARTLLVNDEGVVIKDHWDRKGKAD